MGTFARGSIFVLAACCHAAALAQAAPAAPAAPARSAAAATACPTDDSGLKLPPGFCATVFADGIGHARHLAVAANGAVYVNTWSGRYYGNDKPPAGGFLVVLEDTTGAGAADVVERFGATPSDGGHGGTGIAIYRDGLFAEANDRIVRYPLGANPLTPQGPATTIVRELPLSGDHPMHPFAIATDGSIYVDVASATNACQVRNRSPLSPGIDPCTELRTRGGVWRYDANKTGQVFSPAERFATGIRNAEGMAIDPAGRIFVTQHGRDQLHSNWPDLYQPADEATLPAEELLLLERGADYGWPECYYDGVRNRLVLAPEYGGDGGNRLGPCADKSGPVAAFPAHWAPNAMVRYEQQRFPVRYRDGVFIAFHGSWNRAPYPQGGYNVVFQPLSGEHAAGRCEIFADGFAGAVKSPEGAAHRPSGLAVGPDGALYVSDDVRGRIYRITYRGGASDTTAFTPCPSDSAGPGTVSQEMGGPPEGTHPDAGASAAAGSSTDATATLPLPPGATRQMLALGERIYHGQVGGAGCTGCHGDSGRGTTLGPNLADHQWLWSDGSYPAIARTISAGVSQPKEYRSPMPPMGGARLTSEQVSAVAAYVWALSHGNNRQSH